MNILVVFYSMYGHVYRIAEAIVEGAGSVKGIKADIRRIPLNSLLKRFEQMGALAAQKAFEMIPICTTKDLHSADTIIFGTSGKSDKECTQLKQFIEVAGKRGNDWVMADKPAGTFSSSVIQYVNQGSDMLGVHVALIERGMLMVDFPFSFGKQVNIKDIARDHPSGISFISEIKRQPGPGENEMPSENELRAAMLYGKQFATIALKLYNTGLNGLTPPQHGSSESNNPKKKRGSLWDEVRSVPNSEESAPLHPSNL